MYLLKIKKFIQIVFYEKKYKICIRNIKNAKIFIVGAPFVCRFREYSHFLLKLLKNPHNKYIINTYILKTKKGNVIYGRKNKSINK